VIAIGVLILAIASVVIVPKYAIEARLDDLPLVNLT
jgi:hypothetical protein